MFVFFVRGLRSVHVVHTEMSVVYFQQRRLNSLIKKLSYRSLLLLLQKCESTCSEAYDPWIHFTSVIVNILRVGVCANKKCCVQGPQTSTYARVKPMNLSQT